MALKMVLLTKQCRATTAAMPQLCRVLNSCEDVEYSTCRFWFELVIYTTLLSGKYSLLIWKSCVLRFVATSWSKWEPWRESNRFVRNTLQVMRHWEARGGHKLWWMCIQYENIPCKILRFSFCRGPTLPKQDDAVVDTQLYGAVCGNCFDGKSWVMLVIQLWLQ